MVPLICDTPKIFLKNQSISFKIIPRILKWTATRSKRAKRDLSHKCTLKNWCGNSSQSWTSSFTWTSIVGTLNSHILFHCSLVLSATHPRDQQGLPQGRTRQRKTATAQGRGCLHRGAPLRGAEREGPVAAVLQRRRREEVLPRRAPTGQRTTARVLFQRAEHPTARLPQADDGPRQQVAHDHSGREGPERVYSDLPVLGGAAEGDAVPLL